MSQEQSGLRSAVRFVAIANLAYFGVEFAVALSIGSVSLFADSVDFLEDACVNLLILTALAWSARDRARLDLTIVWQRAVLKNMSVCFPSSDVEV